MRKQLIQVGSLSIVCCFLRQWSALYIFVGCLFMFFITWKSCWWGLTEWKLGLSLFYGLTNITIVSKCPLASRIMNYKPMLFVSLFCVVYHSTALLIIIICYSIDGSIFPAYISSTRLNDYSVTSIVLIMGPVSVLGLRWLKSTVRQMDVEGDDNHNYLGHYHHQQHYHHYHQHHH